MIMCRDSDGLLARSIAGVCVCVSTPVSKDTTLAFF